MLIAIDEHTLLNIEKVRSLLIRSQPETKKVLISSGFLGMFPSYEETVVQKWSLEMIDTNSIDGKSYTFTQTSISRDSLEKTATRMISRLRKLENILVDEELEKVLLTAEDSISS